MNTYKIIAIVTFSLAIGLGAGYFLFSKNDVSQDKHNHANTNHQSPITNHQSQEWICSMHPQVRQNEAGLCPICEMDLILAESNESNDPLVLQMTEDAVKMSNIETTVVGQKTEQANKTTQLTGKVQADERLASSQVTHVPGRIEKLYVSFTGEKVNKGQQLADIYSPELITAQRELLEALKLQTVNPKLVDAARSKLRYWKIKDDLIEQIEKSGEIQEVFPLFAEASGIVTERKVAVGNHLNQGEPLFSLMNLQKVWVIFDAYEEDLANIKMGDKIVFTAAAIPNKTFKAKVTFIDPLIHPTTRTVAVRTEVSNANGLLKPEMFVDGILQHRAVSKQQLTVPKSAVLWTGKRSVVYTKVPDRDIPSFKFREVELGEAIGDSYQVVSGLESGEEVVTYGSFTIDAAAQLNNQASMMNKNVKPKKPEQIGVPNFQAETSTLFKEQLNDLANAYFQLKDALVATDAATAATAAEKVVVQLEKVDGRLVKEEAHIYWMEQLNALQAHSTKITKMNNVEAQRKQFGFLSDALIKVIEAFGTAGETLYVQYCPMAFDDEGADWLATEEQIQNPYFGDKMMRCGWVKKELSDQIE
ncbi:MAG: efflux RND transporter periplasmic adaptor subunit [Bacteroidota bacterium]